MSILNSKGPEDNLTAEEWLHKGTEETDPKKEIQYYTKAIELAPNFAIAYFGRGGAYSGLGEYEKAISDYTKVIELTPGFADTYYLRGGIYDQLGEYNKAAADRKKAKELTHRG